MMKSLIFVVLLIVSVVGGFFVYRNYLMPRTKTDLSLTPTPSLSPFKIYESKNLDFSVQVPERYQIDERNTFVDFKDNDNNIIGTARTAHASNSLKQFLNDTDERSGISRKIEIADIQISNLQASIRDEVRGGKSVRQYYIFTPEWIYVFSTDNESLYSDLDQIAQSFQYTPN